MAIRGSRDDFEAGLTGLQAYDADPPRIDLIRARCLAVLEAQRQRDRRHRMLLSVWPRWLEPAAALALSALYLAAAVHSTFTLLH